MTPTRCPLPLPPIARSQGDGVPPSEARDFCDWLTAGKAGDLTGLPYAVCALGDTSYTHFCACGKALNAALGAAGAGRLSHIHTHWGHGVVC